MSTSIGSVLGLSKKEIDRKFDEIIDFAEVIDFIDTPVQSYSSGMQVRLGFAVATAFQPDILLLDEVLAVGDVRFRWKCLERIKRLRESGVSLILVSHHSADLMRTCTKGLVLEAGKRTFDGSIEEAVLGYEHPSRPGTSRMQTRGNGTTSPVHILAINYLVDGSPATTMRSGDALDVVIEVESLREIDQARICFALFHSEFGMLFAVSSFASLGWISIRKGTSTVAVSLGRLPIQYGSYYIEAAVLGTGISDFLDIAIGTASLKVTAPVPDYEGFGVNGVPLPSDHWSLTRRVDQTASTSHSAFAG